MGKKLMEAGRAPRGAMACAEYREGAPKRAARFRRPFHELAGEYCRAVYWSGDMATRRERGIFDLVLQ